MTRPSSIDLAICCEPDPLSLASLARVAGRIGLATLASVGLWAATAYLMLSAGRALMPAVARGLHAGVDLARALSRLAISLAGAEAAPFWAASTAWLQGAAAYSALSLVGVAWVLALRAR
jgi:hypothetical protein